MSLLTLREIFLRGWGRPPKAKMDIFTRKRSSRNDTKLLVMSKSAEGNGEYLWSSVAFVEVWIKSNAPNDTTGLKNHAKCCTKIKPVTFRGVQPLVEALVRAETEVWVPVKDVDGAGVLTAVESPLPRSSHRQILVTVVVQVESRQAGSESATGSKPLSLMLLINGYEAQIWFRLKQGNPAFSYRTGFHCNILLYYHYIIASTVLLFLKKFLLLLWSFYCF